jgi:hypothetical protein
VSLLSFLSALRKDTGPDYVTVKQTMPVLDSAAIHESIRRRFISKDGPVASDAHVSTALGGKPKKKKPGEPGNDGLPVASMTLVAQQPTGQTTAKFAEVLKVDDSLGLVLGWAIVCKKDGCDYFDLQEDHIPEASMLSAAVDFMQNSRVAKEMHTGEASGSVLFAFPLTGDIATAFGVETKTTGLMIAMKPDSEDMLAKFRDGTLTGFSIGGHRIDDEDAP